MNGQKGHPHPSDLELIQGMNAADESCFKKLFNRYLPLVKSFWSRYYVRLMDIEDWFQESRITIIKAGRKYRTDCKINFGSYYRMCLKNRCFDFIRKQSAKKRIPNKYLTSFNAHEDYYNDVLNDVKAVHPENALIMKEKYQWLYNHSSRFERKVLYGLFKCQTLNEIAVVNRCSFSKVTNAYERCKLKLRRWNTDLD